MPLKNIFNSSSSSSSLADEQQSTSPHRSMLRKKHSSSTISPSSTASSINKRPSHTNTNATATVQQQQQQQQPHQHQHQQPHHYQQQTHQRNGANNIPSGRSSPAFSPASSTNDVANKEHHTLSLKRFFKKLKPHDSSSSSSSSKSKHPHQYTAGAGKPDPLPSTADLFKKYGQPGKLLGTGASGSVNLLTSKTDPSTVYAVKKFRSRLPSEQEADYKTKVQNEYKVGEFLVHQNVIHTFDLIKDYSHTNSKIVDPDYYIVMEYCPFDFFNLVMSGLMETREVACYFKQIVNGVHFLHENGLAHRDLKLDNCVVNPRGVLKLIDFGSAIQFRKEVPSGYYVTDSDIMLSPKHKLIMARGVVGSDPYLSPEVFEPMGIGYDPRTADVWSIAIIYCCMILKRFPWKLPKLSDPSYKSFAGPQLNIHNGSIEEDINNMHLDNHSNNSNSGDYRDRHAHHPPIGPERLLRLLPQDSRNVIKKMLVLDPKKRYLMSDVSNDPFVQSIQECKVIGQHHVDEHVISSSNHKHHLVSEEDLKKITQEKDRAKRLKEAGMA
ncbi:uncharacterized protein LODBEIA_P33510 [Lodderomyces beijingensis]|uniref:non-specific serine/threonine protein kinase n=1 Tax=Lodderomyces beijingensis TaxID=1775926 RepID=A0ABP0ZP52_9ASCO